MKRATTFFKEGIKKFPIRWRKCISVEGNYGCFLFGDTSWHKYRSVFVIY